MFCQNCGTEIKETMKHCPNCGKEVHQKEKKSVMALYVGLFFLPLLAIPWMWVKRDDIDKETKKKLTVIAGVWLLVLCFLPKQKTTTTQTPTTTQSMQTEKTQVEKEITFNITPQQYLERSNSFVKSKLSEDEKFLIEEIKIQNGDVNNVCRYDFGFASLVGTIDKSTNHIKEATLIFAGNNPIDFMNSITYYAVMIAAITPEYDRSQIIKDLGLFDKNIDLANMNKQVFRGDCKYSIISSPQIGIWMIVSKND